MRTKALLLAAAVTVATSATAMAQVYSANAVGYVNLTLTEGFHIVSNPLTGSPDNNVATILPFTGAAADGVTVYKWSPADDNYTEIESYVSFFGGWTPATMELNPGDGVFIDVPATAAPLNITFVGEVMQGTLSYPLVSGKFNLIGSQVPQALPLGPADPVGSEPTLEYPAADGDVAYFWDSVNGYDRIFSYVPFFGGWTPGAPIGPTVQVAEGFFLQRAAAATGDWTRDFSVN